MEDYLMLEIDDEREHIRQAREEKIVFQITSSAHDTLPPGTVVRCSTENISRRGLRVQLDRPLSKGSQVELGVEIPNRAGVFFLTGEVKWCKSFDGRMRNHVGVEITEQQSDDFILWQGIFEMWSPICCDFE
jgi:hypothetical protein